MQRSGFGNYQHIKVALGITSTLIVNDVLGMDVQLFSLSQMKKLGLRNVK